MVFVCSATPRPFTDLLPLAGLVYFYMRESQGGNPIGKALVPIKGSGTIQSGICNRIFSLTSMLGRYTLKRICTVTL